MSHWIDAGTVNGVEEWYTWCPRIVILQRVRGGAFNVTCQPFFQSKKVPGDDLEYAKAWALQMLFEKVRDLAKQIKKAIDEDNHVPGTPKKLGRVRNGDYPINEMIGRQVLVNGQTWKITGTDLGRFYRIKRQNEYGVTVVARCRFNMRPGDPRNATLIEESSPQGA